MKTAELNQRMTDVSSANERDTGEETVQIEEAEVTSGEDTGKLDDVQATGPLDLTSRLPTTALPPTDTAAARQNRKR